MARQVELPTVDVRTRGPVSASEIGYARKKVVAITRLAPEPVLFVRIGLDVVRHAAADQRAVAQANVDVNGRLVRAQAVAETIQEAVDRIAGRLRVRFERIARH